MKNQQFDVVFIDFFGTIADGDRGQVEATCRRIVSDHELSLPAPEFALRWGKRFFATADESNHDHFRTLYECECISLRETMEELGVECDPIPYADELQRYWRNPPLHAEAKDALEALTVPVCCVSNADEADLLDAFAAHGLRFDGLVSSERARSYKPDPGIFQYAMKMMGVSPDRCVHVGDSLHSDIRGAQELGITGVWIERDDRIGDIGDSKPDLTIKSLLELELFLG